eukprot:GILI01035522.1.p1 GENE.GILI01035522.1~~GILI01035522.1.p1  ORF type:complete len:389 (+),score=49.62 GILI01035522.1:34-1200(+)
MAVRGSFLVSSLPAPIDFRLLVHGLPASRKFTQVHHNTYLIDISAIPGFPPPLSDRSVDDTCEAAVFYDSHTAFSPDAFVQIRVSNENNGEYDRWRLIGILDAGCLSSFFRLHSALPFFIAIILLVDSQSPSTLTASRSPQPSVPSFPSRPDADRQGPNHSKGADVGSRSKSVFYPSLHPDDVSRKQGRGHSASVASHPLLSTQSTFDESEEREGTPAMAKVWEGDRRPSTAYAAAETPKRNSAYLFRHYPDGSKEDRARDARRIQVVQEFQRQVGLLCGEVMQIRPSKESERDPLLLLSEGERLLGSIQSRLEDILSSSLAQLSEGNSAGTESKKLLIDDQTRNLIGNMVGDVQCYFLDRVASDLREDRKRLNAFADRIIAEYGGHR